MNTITTYVLEANVALILFVSVYWLLLRNENQFAFNRIFLLTGIGASLLLPLLHFNLALTETFAPSFQDSLPTYWLPQTTIIRYAIGGASSNVWSFEAITKWTYFSVALVMLLLFAYRLLRILILRFNNPGYRWRSCHVAESNSKALTFSFFNFIFLGQADMLCDKEKEAVLEHELVHVRRMHSFDIILINLVQIVFWFNPFVLLYKRSLIGLHEFEADASVVKKSDVDEYCTLLAKVALESAGYSIGNHINRTHLTARRIDMMNTIKRKISPLKFGGLSLALLLVFFVVACQDQLMNDNPGPPVATSTNFPQTVINILHDLQMKNPSIKYVLYELPKADRNSSEGNTTGSSLRAWEIKAKDDSKVYHISETGAITILEKDSNGQSFFQIVDDMPQFKGGYDSLSVYIQHQLKYPKEAMKAGAQGKVFVQFFVERWGSVTHVEVVKGIHALCDAEAMRVVNGMPKWLPGKKDGRIVRAKFILPIDFRIDP